MKRVVLFLATNMAILLVLAVVLRLVEGYMVAHGIEMELAYVIAMAAVFGMGGSFISLAISKWMAIRTTGAQVIETPSNDGEAWLVETVRQQAQAAGIGMPQVAIFPSDAPNAFATGARRDKALVAVSTGLLRGMKRDEIEAVLAHEVSHIANGDMVTMTLIQGVLNTFVLLLSRVIGGFVDRVVFRNEEGYGIGYFVTSIVAQIVLGILASIIVAWFSRQREFRADAGGAHLAGTNAMIGALRRLGAGEAEPLPDSMEAMGISSSARGYRRFFHTHPPIDVRIRALEMGEFKQG
jgi:heat shock protein HtpX